MPGFVTDTLGITHAKSQLRRFNEATALGVAEFRRCSMMESTVGTATRLTISIEAPATVHEVPMQRLNTWLEYDGKSR
jgi:hypothetical protein